MFFPFDFLMTLLVTMGPLKVMLVFAALAKPLGSSDRRRVAAKAVVVAFLVGLLFIVGGKFLMDLFHFSIAALRIAGGIILFLFALQMVLGDGGHSHEDDEVDDPTGIAIYPLALPIMASPIGIVALTLASARFNDDPATLALIAVLLLVVMTINWIVLIGESKILKYIRPELIGVTERVLGILLAALAAQVILTGIAEADIAFITTGGAP